MNKIYQVWMTVLGSDIELAFSGSKEACEGFQHAANKYTPDRVDFRLYDTHSTRPRFPFKIVSECSSVFAVNGRGTKDECDQELAEMIGQCRPMGERLIVVASDVPDEKAFDSEDEKGSDRFVAALKAIGWALMAPPTEWDFLIGKDGKSGNLHELLAKVLKVGTPRLMADCPVGQSVFLVWQEGTAIKTERGVMDCDETGMAGYGKVGRGQTVYWPIGWWPIPSTNLDQALELKARKAIAEAKLS